MSTHLRYRAAGVLAIGFLVTGSIFTWSSYLDSSSPNVDSDYRELVYDQERALRNVFDRYIDLIESRDPESASLFYRRYGELSKRKIRDRLTELLMGYVDKYGNVHGYKVDSLNDLSISPFESERKRLVVFNCEWLKTGYYFTREDCRLDADDLVATHPLKGLIDEESRLIDEKLEARWHRDKELASIKALHHFLWTLTISMLLFVGVDLIKRFFRLRRSVTKK